MQSQHWVEFPDFTVLEFQYRVIQLNRLDWRSYLRQPNPVAAALIAKMSMTVSGRARVKLECLRMLATLKLDRARMQLISDFVDTYLRLSAQEEQQVQGLTLTTLEQLSEALLDFAEPADLQQWLTGQETSQI